MKVAPEIRKRPWSLRLARDNRAGLSLDPSGADQLRITVESLASGREYDVQLNKSRYEVTAGAEYKLTFRARADAVRNVCIGFSMAAEPWSNLGLYRKLELRAEWADLSADFVATSNEVSGRIHFDLGEAAIAVELASVQLWRITETGLVAVERSESSPRRLPGSAPEESLDADLDAGDSWVLSLPNPPGARPIPSFRMFGVLGTWMEADVVAATVRNALAQGCERVFLVDNGSTDGTVEAACEAGAVVGRSFSTPRYDEALRLRHMNDVVSEVSQAESDEYIWWLFLDADEFHHGPWGMTLREYLATLDEKFRIVGTRFFNHYPDDAPYYKSGRHPLDYQPLCEELAFPMCSGRHRKHPLQRYDRGRAPITCGDGFHSATCEEQLYEPSQPAFLHHFPFREETLTRQRLEALWARDNDGTTRATASQDTHMLSRFRSMDAVYAQRWDGVENFVALDPVNEIVKAPASGVNLRSWHDTAEPEHQPVRRWYESPMVGVWKYANTEKFHYGDDVTYRLGMEFLDGHGAIEDWGCGFTHARYFVSQSRYIGIDGSSKWADKIADLRAYTSDTECIFMRHVLEHNLDWKRILANAVASFRQRMVLIIFTPFCDTTHVISSSQTVTAVPVPDISFRKEDLTALFEGLKYSEQAVETDTQYGTEHLFYLEK